MAVQIDTELWNALLDHFFPGDEAPPAYLEDEIRRGLQAKVDKMQEREFFSRYKRTPTGPERETLRRTWLDARGVPSSYRTAQEQPYEEPPAE